MKANVLSKRRFFFYPTLVMIFTIIVTTTLAAASPVDLLHQGTGFTTGSDLSRPLGIFFDRHHNECYVTDTGNNQVIVYDNNGIPVYKFFHYVVVNGDRVLGEPKSVVVNDDGLVFLTDTMAPYLDVLDHRGKSLKRIYPPDDACDASERFDFLCLGPDNRVYATLTCSKIPVVVIVDPDLAVERVLKLRGAERGAAPTPTCTTGIGVDVSGNIYVTDPCAPQMVHTYNPDGEFISGFGSHDTGVENFAFPAGIVVMPRGDLWIIDTIRQVASHFTAEGEFINYFGGKGDGFGAFKYPSSVSTDGADRLYVLERVGNRYQCFRVLADQSTAPGDNGN